MPPARLILLALAVALPARAETPPELAANSWVWVALEVAGERLAVAAPERYTLAFLPEGRITLQADCNRGAGRAVFPEPGAVRLGPIALTRALCPPESLSDRYVAELARAARWRLQEGALLLEAADGGGGLRFAPAP